MSWKSKLKGQNKIRAPPDNLAEILSTYRLKVGGTKSPGEIQGMIDGFLDMEYDLGMKGQLYNELKARFEDGAVERAYRGEVKAPPKFPKPPLHPPAPATKRNGFSVRSITGGRRKNRKTRRRHSRA